MRLSQLILANMERILVRWEAFAKSLPPGGRMSQKALRNDAERMLRFVAADMETGQSPAEQTAKAEGHGPLLASGELSAAHDHGMQRVVDGFDVDQMVSEYRVLRSTVTDIWKQSGALDGSGAPGAVDQLIRFNESIDQILAESVMLFNAKLDRDKDLLTAVLGHDLRNPLTAIAMSAEALMRSELRRPELELATRIARSASRMRAMIHDLLDFTRVRLGGRLPMTPEPCDLVELCGHVVDELRQAHPRRQLTVRADGRCVGVWDAGRLSQLLSNLVGNAIQHGSADTPVAVTVRCTAQAGVVSVHNFGPAIPPQRQEAIFDPLSRGEKDRAEYGGSLGLGLYIAREIAEAHSGTISVHSSDEAGTTFNLSLPR